MAQNPKASNEESVRKSLRDAVAEASGKLEDARDAYVGKRSLATLRAVQVASDALDSARAALKRFDDDRSLDAVRRSDASPQRARSSWPVGKPYDDVPRRSHKPPKPPREKPDLPPPPAARPAFLQTRTEVTKDGKKEHVSWWCGVDRATLTAGAQTIAHVPPEKTSAVPSKGAIRKAQQKVNEEKRSRTSAAERLSGELQEKLKPMSGAFTAIPQAE